VTKEVGDLIVSAVCAPLQTKSSGGARYILTFIDGAYRLTSTHLIVKKSEVTAEWKKYKAHFENQYDCKIKKLFTENGGETSIASWKFAGRAVRYSAHYNSHVHVG
jgi:hypothetical protein